MTHFERTAAPVLKWTGSPPYACRTHEGPFAARLYPAIIFFLRECGVGLRASVFSFHRSNPGRAYSGLNLTSSQMLTNEKIQSSSRPMIQSSDSLNSFFLLPLCAITLI